MLGIAMGIGLILALGSIGEGLNKQVEESFGDVVGVIDVRAQDGDEGISVDVIDGIADIKGVETVIPVGTFHVTRGFKGGGGMMMFRKLGGSGGGASIEFTGLNPEDQDYLIGEQIIAVEGRKLEDSDDGSLVVLIGSSVAEQQVLNLGDEIEYKRKEDDKTESFYFRVVGILEETGQNNIDGATYVPLKTMQEIEDDDKITSLKVKINDVELVEEVTQDINDYFDEVKAFSFLVRVRQLESTLGSIQLAVYGIGAISIIVGGIGIMNTMIMSVMERRREIGVMKAIGATTTMILTQVLQESAFLSVIGGFIGLMLGYASSILITQYTTFTTILTLELIAIGLGFSLVLGMGAGLYPAWAASQLDPIEVLRYE
ncbi:MAG: FtsX-like permease family protein [Candidatus Altiarchaeota archaeon]|nr:FtsX-like permease family protein [Candidatus Altiarchaeota archaeon]